MKKLLGIFAMASLLGQSSNGQANDIGMIASATYASSYVAKPGIIVQKSPSMQFFLKGQYQNISAFVWKNLSDKTDEIDIGIDYTYNHDKKNKISGGYRLWKFREGDPDDIIEFNLEHEGDINASVKVSKVIERKDLATNITLSKETSITKELKFTPSASTSYINKFYNHTGWSHITLGGTLSYNINDNINIALSGNTQTGMIPKIEDCEYAKAGITIKL